jgi:hypothetical protein
MVLEFAVKYMVATAVLLVSLFFGWLLSAKYLEPLIFSLFSPKNHEEYLDYWFQSFLAIESSIVLVYVFAVYKIYNSARHLTKCSSGR